MILAFKSPHSLYCTEIYFVISWPPSGTVAKLMAISRLLQLWLPAAVMVYALQSRSLNSMMGFMGLLECS